MSKTDSTRPYRVQFRDPLVPKGHHSGRPYVLHFSGTNPRGGHVKREANRLRRSLRRREKIAAMKVKYGATEDYELKIVRGDGRNTALWNLS